MTDAFDIHAGSVKADKKTAATLVQLQKENDLLTDKVIEEGQLRASLERQIEEMEDKIERFEEMERAIADHIGPLIISVHRGVGLMSENLKSCIEEAAEGERPVMEIVPGMSESFEARKAGLSNHILKADIGDKEAVALSLKPLGKNKQLEEAANALVGKIIDKLMGE